jgi:hypothetical protein
MALTTRQTSLLIQQDWTKIYQTFQSADFSSYDFETLRKTMVDYLRTNYPEDFNDFTDSSEYIALIDLIAFMGQSLAFRADLNARENFIDTAQRQDSVFKLSRLVGYSPKRNIGASGLLKIDNVSTTETVYDSNGTDLTNSVVNWNDSSNDNWQEQMNAILNATFVNTQVVGKPASSATINNILTDTYSVSIVPGQTPVYSFTATVENKTMSFEAVSSSTTNSLSIFEPPPIPRSIFNILYRNDSLGNGSNNTGFFIQFKQGSLNKVDFSLTESIPNRTVAINFNNINNDDTWLYGLNSQNAVSTPWSKVSAVAGINVTYNRSSDRNIYQVNTRANDQLDLIFGDGVFANTPQGNYRFIYRQSNGLNYKISPSELNRVSIPISYVSRSGRVETLTVTASLYYTVSNSTSAESTNAVRANAPQAYYTQNRMITGEDYNILPFSLYNSVLKVKAVNRTSSGVSRFLDVLDVTGKYSSTNIFCDDGYLYRDTNAGDQFTFTFETVGDVNDVIDNKLRPILSLQKVTHFRLENTPRYPVTNNGGVVTWNHSSDITNGSIGTVRDSSGGATISFGPGLAPAESNRQYIEEGAMIKFTAPAGQYFTAQRVLKTGTAQYQGESNYIYATVERVNTTTGVVTINQQVPTGAILGYVIPVMANDFTYSSTNVDEATILRLSTLIRGYNSFGIRYDIPSRTWKLITISNLNTADAFNLEYAGDTSGSGLDSSWLITVIYNNGVYTVTHRGLNYIFESLAETTFYFDSGVKVYDSKSAQTVRDQIKILKINPGPDLSTPLGQDITWQIYSNVVASDGYQDPSRVLVTFPDSDNDGVPDDPDLFKTVVDPSISSARKVVFFKQIPDPTDGSFMNLQPIDNTTIVTDYTTKADILLIASKYPVGTIFYAFAENVFYNLTNNNQLSPNVTTLANYVAYTGRQSLSFQYKHNSPNNRRIDPAPNNIMDLYILTKEYSTDYSAWIADTSGSLAEPLPPTTEELSAAYQDLNNYKALSDTIVYNPAKFKPLFGTKADTSLQATFKVVPNPNIVVSDSEIKSSVVAAINRYFDINNWDFGESFYFSELSAYLHQALTPMVASIIIVSSDPRIQFGSLYQINAEANEIITSAATVNNVEVISAITAAHLNQTTTTSTQIGI